MPDIVIMGSVGSFAPIGSDAGIPPHSQHMLFAALNTRFSQTTPVKIESDVPAEQVGEIEIIGKRMKDVMQRTFVQLGMNANSLLKLPCVGDTRVGEIVNIVGNMVFNVTGKSFGPGRAGANNVGTGNGKVPVDINSTEFIKYSKLTGGLEFLHLHEVAHALASMQKFGNQKFEEYKASAGAGLSFKEQMAKFAETDGFVENEARANTITKAISDHMKNPQWNFVPIYNFATCP